MLSYQAYPEISSPSTSVSSISDDDSSLNPPSPFSDIIVRNLLTKAKFSIYLAECPSQNSQYALKMFPYQDHSPNPFFLREIRFSNLKHPNIIQPLYHETESVTCGAKTGKVSFILSEYAPNGDFFDLVSCDAFSFSEKLTRTYFHQLVAGLEYLHSLKVFHLDLKLENILLDKDFNLRICDFDLSHAPSDQEVLVGGTPDYRAPELIKQNCKNPAAADIYSAAIILFALQSNGILPYKEENSDSIGETLFEMLLHRPKKFWLKHCRLQGKTLDFWSNGFIDLFNGMTRPKPEERMTIQEIKASEWYNGPIFTQCELKSFMSKYFD